MNEIKTDVRAGHGVTYKVVALGLNTVWWSSPIGHMTTFELTKSDVRYFNWLPKLALVNECMIGKIIDKIKAEFQARYVAPETGKPEPTVAIPMSNIELYVLIAYINAAHAGLSRIHPKEDAECISYIVRFLGRQYGVQMDHVRRVPIITIPSDEITEIIMVGTAPYIRIPEHRMCPSKLAWLIEDYLLKDGPLHGFDVTLAGNQIAIKRHTGLLAIMVATWYLYDNDSVYDWLPDITVSARQWKKFLSYLEMQVAHKLEVTTPAYESVMALSNYIRDVTGISSS